MGKKLMRNRTTAIFRVNKDVLAAIKAVEPKIDLNSFIESTFKKFLAATSKKEKNLPEPNEQSLEEKALKENTIPPQENLDANSVISSGEEKTKENPHAPSLEQPDPAIG